MKATFNSSASIPTKALYEVVSPRGMPVSQKKFPDTQSTTSIGEVSPSLALRDLHGKKIGLICGVFTNSDVLLEAFMDILSKRFEDLEFIKLPSGKNLRWGEHADESIGNIAMEAGVDAAIVAVGG